MALPLLQTHQKTFSQPVQQHLFATCPTMDLIAAVTAPNQLEVFRFDGQRAFGWRRGTPPLAITALCWSDDGAYISLAMSDGMLEVIEVVMGKIAARGNMNVKSSTGMARGPSASEAATEDAPKRTVIFLGWGRSLLDAGSIRVPSSGKRTKCVRQSKGKDVVDDGTPTLEDYTARILDRRLIEPEAEAEDLPRQLAHLDLESEFPQLSPLPEVEDTLVLDGPSDSYSSLESLNGALPLHGEVPGPASHANLELAFGDDDVVSCFMDKNVNIGTHKLQSANDTTVVGHASHPFSTCHALLKSDTKGLYIQAIAFESISQSKHFVELVRRKTSSLLQLSSYIVQAIVCLRSAWVACQELPRRWIENGQEAIQERDKMDLTTALYLLATMGDCVPSLKEWITTDIGERNHKRWDAAVSSNYIKITELVQRCLLPALDRATVVASRLRSLAATPDIPVFNIDTRYLNRVTHDLELIRLIANRALQYARLEMRQFETFSAWLAIQVALQSAEPGSSTAYEQGERAAAVDVAPLLQYVTEALTRSRLNYFLARPSADVVDAPRRPQQQIREVPLLVQILDRHAEKLLQPGQQQGVVDVVDMLYQALFLRDSCHEVCEALPHGLQRGTRLGPAILVASGQDLVAGVYDVRIVHTAGVEDDFEILVVYTTRQRELILHRMPLPHALAGSGKGGDAERQTKRRLDIGSAPSSQQVEGNKRPQVVAAKFLDDDSLVAIIKPYHKDEKDSGDKEALSARLVLVHYDDWISSDEGTGQDGQRQEVLLLHEWKAQKAASGAQQQFRPAALAVSRDKHRARVAVLDASGRRCEIVTWAV